ncbi:MAG: hypothetical protein HC865_25690 [Cyanobacteria bacterium RU_5_0]|nr:hypothetical protein [Cyanobacteria bacterium RU_5_0]
MIAHTHPELETAQSTAKKPIFKQFTFWLTKASDALFDFLLAEPIIEPKITQVQGRNGEVFWEIYDSRTGRTIYCMTENEVFEWLDSRHYLQ